MKGKKIVTAVISVFLLAGCSSVTPSTLPEGIVDTDDYDWDNPGQVEGGEDAREIPESIKEDISPLEEGVEKNKQDIIDLDTSKVPEGAQNIAELDNYKVKKSQSGDFYLEGTLEVTDDPVLINDGNTNDLFLYLNGVTLLVNNTDHGLKIQSPITLILVDGTENNIIMGESNTDKNGINVSEGCSLTILGNGSLNIESYKRGIDVHGDLIVSGDPSISVKSTNDCLRAGSGDDNIAGCVYLNGGSYQLDSESGSGVQATNISILDGANLDITTSDKDAIHAEMDDSIGEFKYDDGYVYFVDAGKIKIETTGEGDGIQADTFIYIKGGDFEIKVNGGAPSSVSQRTSNAGESKALKAGEIDFINERGNADTLVKCYDYVIAIAGGNFNIDADDDAIHSNGQLYVYGGNICIATGDDAMHAESDIVIEEGAAIGIDRCYEGIEAEVITINGGYVSLYAKDDGINAASLTGRQSDRSCQININGGEIHVSAEGDGLDSNGEITMNGGSLYVNGPSSNRDAALDSEYGIEVNGGNLIAVGASGMLERPSSTSSQYCISYASSSSLKAGAKIRVIDKNENLLISITALRSFQSITISCPEFKLGETYSIYNDENKLIDVTISSMVTNAGSRTGSSGPGNGRP